MLKIRNRLILPNMLAFHRSTAVRKINSKIQTKQKTSHQDTLENQPWFHNDITRQETAELLQLKGQFLIRKTIDSKRRTAVLVLSVNVGSVGIKHFVMQLNDKGQFRLEGVWFNSIQQLLNYHIDTGLFFSNILLCSFVKVIVKLSSINSVSRK